MRTKLIKIGNSSGLVLPRPLLRTLGLDNGDAVEIEYKAKDQVIRLSFPDTKQLKLT